MPIDCESCGSEVEAHSGGRCRVCRKLLCAACLDAPAEEEAAPVCAACRAQGRSAPPETIRDPLGPPAGGPSAGEERAEAGAGGETTTKRPAPAGMLRWLVFGAALFFAFLLIVLYPGLKAAWIGRLLDAPEAATRRRAARTLAELGSQPALDRLLQAAREGPAPVRETAVVGLGEHPDPRAAAFLRDLRDDASVPAVVREAATSALLRHRRLYPDRR